MYVSPGVGVMKGVRTSGFNEVTFASPLLASEQKLRALLPACLNVGPDLVVLNLRHLREDNVSVRSGGA